MGGTGAKLGTRSSLRELLASSGVHTHWAQSLLGSQPDLKGLLCSVSVESGPYRTYLRYSGFSPLSLSFPPSYCYHGSSCPSSQGPGLLWCMADGSSFLAEEARWVKSVPVLFFLPAGLSSSPSPWNEGLVRPSLSQV